MRTLKYNGDAHSDAIILDTRIRPVIFDTRISRPRYPERYFPVDIFVVAAVIVFLFALVWFVSGGKL